MREIKLSDETWARLQKRAIPLEETTDDVVRRLLDDTEGTGTAEKTGGSTSTQDISAEAWQSRAIHGQVVEDITAPSSRVSQWKRRRLGQGLKVAQKEFRGPILETLYEMGGSGRRVDALDEVERKMKSRLTSIDYEIIPSGSEPRWRKSAGWERQLLANEGLLERGSLRGMWELSEQGRVEARKLANGTGE